MAPDEFSRLCVTRHISCDHFMWMTEQLNTMQENTCCIYLNYVNNIQRFVANRVLKDKKVKPSYLVLFLNVGKTSDGDVCIGTELMQGQHFSVCHIDFDKKVIRYCDSLGWKMPRGLMTKVLQIYAAIIGLAFFGFSITAPHDYNQNGVPGHVCRSRTCSPNFPFQTCGSVCGSTALFIGAIACLCRP